MAGKLLYRIQESQEIHYYCCSTPPDFPANDSEVDFTDRATPDTLNDAEKQGMGYLPFSETEAGLTAGQLRAIREHNRIMSS